MRLFMRIAAMLVLFSAPFVGVLRGGTNVSSPEPPVLSTDAVRERGELRLAVREGSLSFFEHGPSSSGFEYELLERFAAMIGVRLVPRLAPGGREAEVWLREGEVDVAVLAPERTRAPGLVAVDGYVHPSGRPRQAPTGELYLRESSRPLRAELHAWIRDTFRDGFGEKVFTRYFACEGARARAARTRPPAPRGRALSPYDRLIARHAEAAGYDWRLLAALIFQESSFDASAISPRGAIGLMQVMPVVGREVGVARLHDPEANVRAGVRYLRRLSERFPDSRGEDLLAIVLSAYLLGPGHVEDARVLARQVGLDPDTWFGSLEGVLPLLEDPRFHEHTRHGYARGRLAVEYVYRIFRVHQHLRQRLGRRPGRVASAPAVRSSAG